MAVSKIKVARVQLDLTQQQLAEKVGVTRQTISLIEKEIQSIFRFMFENLLCSR